MCVWRGCGAVLCSLLDALLVVSEQSGPARPRRPQPQPQPTWTPCDGVTRRGDEAWLQPTMGAGGSSIAACKNDFELVIRATKELEYLLEKDFGVSGGKNSGGLHDKISAARIPHTGQPLSHNVIRKMRKLVTIRNALVHDRDVNSIDRAEFARGWQEVEKELSEALPNRGGSSCLIS